METDELHKKMRLLIAEDDEATRDILEASLTERGFEVVLARDGTEAWQILQRDDAPSLAILDWVMPGLNGLEVCQRARTSLNTYVYILILTAKDSTQDVVIGMDAGADDYIRKPADIDELCARIAVGTRILNLHAELSMQATHDNLTGLLNRGTIVDVLQKELARASRSRTPVSIVLADVDSFKVINDTHGHAVGDSVLRQISERMRSKLRIYDSIGRYGGEEFLMIVPGCDIAAALEVAERLREAVATKPVDTAIAAVAVTASFGVAGAVANAFVDVEGLIVAADKALYRAKAGGRNRVERA